MIKDFEQYDVLSPESLSEGLRVFVGRFIKDQFGYNVIFESRAAIPASKMFKAYLIEKGVDPVDAGL